MRHFSSSEGRLQYIVLMTIACEECKAEPKIGLWCRECERASCGECLRTHADHQQKLRFICQECEEDPSEGPTLFCEECEQHLCGGCDERIHNKGKRAKHLRHTTTWETLLIRHLYVLCSDAQAYYGYITALTLLMDLTDSVPSNPPYVLLIEKTKELSELRKQSPAIIKTFTGGDLDDELVNGMKTHFPMLQEMVLVESETTKGFAEEMGKVELKVRTLRLGEAMGKGPTKMGNLSISSISLPNSSFNNKSSVSNISAKYPWQPQPRNHLSINMSTSTENSLRKRKRKLPILYYHPYICSKGDRRSPIEDQYRHMAANGILMVRRDQCDQLDARGDVKNIEKGDGRNIEKWDDSKVLRRFNRNIGETEVEYVSLQIEMQQLSIECLYWVVRSIEEDRMAPTEKLILSRLKESFDLKVQSKLWHYIIKYLCSSHYEHERAQIDRMGHIPRLMVHPFNNEDNYILYCKPDDVTPLRWVYEDLGELDEDDQAWHQFLHLITHYFLKNTQIGGGRYGCVQYIKFNAPAPLRDASLGKLSMFVQEAINKGIIRYHKTLLVSNRGNEEKGPGQGEECVTLPQLQTRIKVNSLQLVLMDNFMETGPGIPISLAQIPQNLRKNAHFDINYVDLGFPKLKNLLSTLTDTLQLHLTKSHITFHLLPDTPALLQRKRHQISQDTALLLDEVLRHLDQIITDSNLPGITIDELENQLVSRTRLALDCLLFNAPDFYRFLSYYGQNHFNVEINQGYIFVHKKWKQTSPKHDPTSTPTFKYEDNVKYEDAFNPNKYEDAFNQSKYEDAFNQNKYEDAFNPNKYEDAFNQRNHFKSEDTSNMDIPTPTSTPTFSSTPTFKEPLEKFRYLENFNWEESVLQQWETKDNTGPPNDEEDEDNEGDGSESFSDYKSIYNLIDDNKTVSEPQTVIVKEGSMKAAHHGLFTVSNVIEEGEDSCSNGFEDVISDLDPRVKNNKGQHNRMYSNNAQQKTHHYRVYSNMSRH